MNVDDSHTSSTKETSKRSYALSAMQKFKLANFYVITYLYSRYSKTHYYEYGYTEVSDIAKFCGIYIY